MGDEIAAMSAIDKAISGLEEDEAARVLRWAVDKFGGTTAIVAHSVHKSSGAAALRAAASRGSQTEEVHEFERISDMVDAASPSSIVEHVLVASYWFQSLQGREDFTGQEVNSELKDLGHGSANITADFTSLMKKKFARQVQKSGKSQQGRKRYRLTNEGIRRVESMVAGATA